MTSRPFAPVPFAPVPFAPVPHAPCPATYEEARSTPGRGATPSNRPA